MSLNLSIGFGISIILHYNNVFEQLLKNNIVQEINVSMNKAEFLQLRTSYSDDFFYKYYDIMNFVFKNPAIKIHKDLYFDFIVIYDLLNMYNLKINYKINHNLLINNIYINHPYITISTKILGLPNFIQYYQTNKSLFYSILNKSKLPIIILGERKISTCKEYDYHMTNSIYDDIKIYCNNIIDYSIEASINNNDLNDLLKTFDILHQSSLNIYMTQGGLAHMIHYLSNKIVAISYEKQEWFEYDKIVPDIFTDINKFLEKLELKILELNNSTHVVM